MVVYTKKGDRGLTFVLSSKSKSVRKDSPLISAIGAVDEANSYIGICINLLDEEKFQKEIKLLFDAQNNLFTMGAHLAGFTNKIKKAEVRKCEDYIDEKEVQLPVLTNFILPGGSTTSSHLMFTRSLVRKAEREVVRLSGKRVIDEDVLRYLNRLSDAVFIISRYVNYKMGVKEKVWAGRVK